MEEKATFKDWGILELMGHRRLAGIITEAQLGGASFLRIDIPDGDKFTTQFYSPQAVYCITPTTERVAREVAKVSASAPVSRWDVPQLYKGNKSDDEFCGVEDGDEDD